ncbi:hypothetical protein [Paracoccus mutanolyticus]|uniref:hypothetical protein n=1 Tax=Paracoccus mutanolyticus TaxID=1499308 RepID=UPI0011AE4077|nr:hypothetical protein [Paracoccus mutanolyticus]
MFSFGFYACKRKRRNGKFIERLPRDLSHRPQRLHGEPIGGGPIWVTTRSPWPIGATANEGKSKRNNPYFLFHHLASMSAEAVGGVILGSLALLARDRPI